ncbi:SRPBCC family protein [Halobacterium salinarum]|uniref:Carbon monoxide dehydrogenase subunit G n=1 Tax=Halobacterium salinarum (strain ATCC 33171 / DSM 3754 / JCM 8978 / NBRC 102687 / NCIMB 764 / 91-R6) TaxID=2597657 RepID=A0A4D6GS18_HALS9|nr:MULTISPECIES: SRPBCC family protein [Halobacterium]MDL0124319.1 SRPBCC family protein [Halobacterium salinarum]MDL0127297.1 SRPBCC family protein [Halobacterium salinarum]MDL0135933.1 SRPBCC family protein [Halobacterium salinarum]MDL0139985.1 SRPBCC family protein [Halobacterium salinarum]MDL0144286.1 SRPBCC family protein [Halobacterium salinarum]
MTVRVERTFELAVPPEDVWAFISDPEKRADAISVVDSYTTTGDTTTWHVELPIPVVRRTIDVETRDVDVRPPTFVKFIGKSGMFDVTGEHEIEPADDGSTLTNRFVVDGSVPGVEQFFKRNLDDELDRLQRKLADA